MKNSYDLFFSIMDTISKEMRNKDGSVHPVGHGAGPVDCLPCHAEKDWATKLGDILVRHKVSLEKFAHEVNSVMKCDCPLFRIKGTQLEWTGADDGMSCIREDELRYFITRSLPAE